MKRISMSAATARMPPTTRRTGPQRAASGLPKGLPGLSGPPVFVFPIGVTGEGVALVVVGEGVVVEVGLAAGVVVGVALVVGVGVSVVAVMVIRDCARKAPEVTSETMTVAVEAVRLVGRWNVPLMFPLTSDRGAGSSKGIELVPACSCRFTAVLIGSQLAPVKVMASPLIPAVGLRVKVGVPAVDCPGAAKTV